MNGGIGIFHDDVTKHPQTAAQLACETEDLLREPEKRRKPQAMMLNSLKSSAFRKSPQESEIKSECKTYSQIFLFIRLFYGCSKAASMGCNRTFVEHFQDNKRKQFSGVEHEIEQTFDFDCVYL